ncbi:MAG: hypothetical protein IT292_06185 [Deltaproteobacteria bacterium]|nr:hypothetical protein [Deltaproteobacteria bacterium]
MNGYVNGISEHSGVVNDFIAYKIMLFFGIDNDWALVDMLNKPNVVHY